MKVKIQKVNLASSFQTWTVCVQHKLLYERRVVGYLLHLRPNQRKWTCCGSVKWRKILAHSMQNTNFEYGCSCCLWQPSTFNCGPE